MTQQLTLVADLDFIISHSKVWQGRGGTIYLDVSLEAKAAAIKRVTLFHTAGWEHCSSKEGIMNFICKIS